MTMASQLVRFKRLDSRALVPEYKTLCASGADLHAIEDFELAGGSTRLVRTGIAVEIPIWLEAQVRPRSGLSKAGILCAFGTIDADYSGEIGVVLTNLGVASRKFSAGDRIAQLVVAPIERVSFQEVDDLSETGRGAGGFGSTGR
jgi:dUTP pyrophosphatase